MPARFLLVFLVACQAPTPGSTEPEPEAEAEAEVEAEAEAPDPNSPPGSETGPGPGKQPEVDGRQLMARLQQAANIMRAMRDAAIEAETGDGTECEKAFAGITAAVRASIEGTTELGHRPPSWQVAPRDQYMAMCTDLPAPVQRCSRFAYRMQNSEECNPILEGVSDATKRVLNRMSSRVPRQGTPE